MRIPTIIIRGLAMIIIVMLVMPRGILAQDYLEEGQSEMFKKEELYQMLAPVALYPDSLIAQILMASTYPLEVVEAERWLRQKRHLKGDELNNALQAKTWDPSIKLLCHFPDVLFAMSDKLDQTRKLGDAFLAQQDEVMATIQELRQKAKDQGNLKTTKEQQVIIEREIIRIEPAVSGIVYVPVYDPFYVYGPWWYPAYPPYYWYYPPGFVVTHGFISFGPRVFIGIGLFSWAWFDWHVHHIHIDINKTRRFHIYRDRRDFDKHIWIHEPRHRKGVAYRGWKVSERFGSRPPRVSSLSPEIRGYPDRRIEKEERRPSMPVESRESREVIRPSAKTERERIQPHVSLPAPEKRGDTSRRIEREDRRPQVPVARKEATRPPVEQERIQRAPVRDNTFKGIGSGNFERKASERGSISRQGREIRLPSVDTGRQGVGRDSVRTPAGGRDGGRSR